MGAGEYYRQGDASRSLDDAARKVTVRLKPDTTRVMIRLKPDERARGGRPATAPRDSINRCDSSVTVRLKPDRWALTSLRAGPGHALQLGDRKALGRGFARLDRRGAD